MADYSQVIDGLNDLIQFDKRLLKAATTVHNLMAQRIFGEGRAASGKSIGNYSTEPFYISPGKSPKKFTSVGIGGKTKFKNGKPHKTRYFANGYTGFRQKAGRQTGHVDLRLTGTLENSFIVEASGVNYVSGFINEKQALIAEGNEEHFAVKVFELTEDEENKFVELMIPL